MSVAQDLKYTLSADPAKLDVPWCLRAIREANHTGGFGDGQIRTALQSSLCIGAYVAADGVARQIGLIRFVTDSAIFSSLTELYVEPDFRNKGVATRLLGEAFMHEAVKPTLCILRARPHLWLFYFRNADFHLIDRAHGIMQRVAR
jgi:GNAT superfamily N-acetyltransferase